jgi:hypothetical protein
MIVRLPHAHSAAAADRIEMSDNPAENLFERRRGPCFTFRRYVR